MSYLSRFFRTSAKLSRGFTLAEMITVTAIFVIVTGILLMNLPDFKSRTNIDIVAQQIALNIRGAQVFSVGTKAGSVVDTDSGLLPSYGVNFNLGSRNSYLLYLDQPSGVSSEPNHFYDPGLIPGCFGECEETYQIEPYFSITDLCAGSGPDCESKSSLDIFFERPKVRAEIFGDTVSEDNNFAGIQLCSNRNTETCRVIRIYASGQIEVLKGNIGSVSW